jgi:hypothetical protein
LIAGMLRSPSYDKDLIPVPRTFDRPGLPGRCPVEHWTRPREDVKRHGRNPYQYPVPRSTTVKVSIRIIMSVLKDNCSL